MNGSVTYSATMVASLLLGFGDSYITHETAIHPHGLFLKHVYDNNPAANTAIDDDVTDTTDISWSAGVQQESNGSWYSSLVTKVDDYLYRPEELEDLSPILYTMLYYKKSKGLSDIDNAYSGSGKYTTYFTSILHLFARYPRTTCNCHPRPGVYESVPLHPSIFLQD